MTFTFRSEIGLSFIDRLQWKIHMFRYIIFPALLLSAMVARADDEEVRQLVRKLGDDSFVVRERAEEHLFRAGADALAELQLARNDADVEIARRAERILSRFEQLSLGQESEVIRYWVTYYALHADPLEKAKVIWLLCNSFSDARDGVGLHTLCRIARFDENNALRAEAVKGLIASPPIAPTRQRKWYRSIRDTFHEPGDDELLQLLVRFAELRCDLDDRKDAAEVAAEKEAKRTGIPVTYPVSLPVDENLQRRVRELTDGIALFQADPKNNEIHVGNRNDILLFYALAELQDLAGLAVERDRVVAAAAAVRTEESTGEDLFELGGARPFYDHLYVSRGLLAKFRLAWAKAHFDLVIEHGDIPFKIDACHLATTASQFQKNYSEVVRYCDRAIELADSKEFKEIQNNSAELLKRFRVCRFLTLAQQAAETGDLDLAKKHVDAGLKLDPFEPDTLILAWQCHQKNLAVGGDQREIDPKIDAAIRNVERQIYREGNAEQRRAKAIDTCNQVAWLLANTGGEYELALNLIEEAVKEEPESVAYLDTLAHVYHLGKQYDKAVETQEKVVKLAPECIPFHEALQRFRRESQGTK